jgi:hypothetical protein
MEKNVNNNFACDGESNINFQAKIITFIQCSISSNLKIAHVANVKLNIETPGKILSGVSTTEYYEIIWSFSILACLFFFF